GRAPIPALAAELGSAERARAVRVLSPDLRPLPRLPVPALQLAANEAAGDGPRICPAGGGASEPGCYQEQHRSAGSHRGVAAAGASAPALPERDRLRPRQPDRGVRSAGLVGGPELASGTGVLRGRPAACRRL